MPSMGTGELKCHVILETNLRAVADRARIEAAAGAPAGIVAVYVGQEIEHLIDGPEHDEQWCDICARWRDREDDDGS